jgi:hypothetical protein
MTELTEEQGELAVKIARKAVDTFLAEGKRYEPEEIPEIFKEDRGVFVTLSKYPNHELRGCIGFPEPVAPFIDALIDAGISAASRDPRFDPVQESELKNIVVEVSALTLPEKLEAGKPDEYPKKIKVGRDGLIIKKGFQSGLLLPQVPVDQGWDEKEFLSQTCWKAGLPPDSWMDPETEIMSFKGQVWQETEPYGKIKRKELK